MVKIRGKDMLVIEAHAHVWKKFGGQRLGKFKQEALKYGKVKQGDEIFHLLTPEYEDCSVKIEVYEEYMEYLGIDKAVILQNPCYGDQREYLRDIINRSPGKFVTIGMLDPRKKDTVKSEIDTLMKNFNCSGIKIEIPDVPFIMDDHEYDFLWKKIMDNDGIAVIDLGWGDGPYDFNIDRLRNVIKKYPDIKMVLPHLGVSRLWDLNQKYPYESLQKTLSLLEINKDNLWFDFGGIQFYNWDDEYPFYRSLDILKTVKETCGMEKVMWGTDYPTVLKQGSYRQALDIVLKHCDFFSDEDMENVLGRNATKIYFKNK